jgi:purine-cytosine permease-like protein
MTLKEVIIPWIAIRLSLSYSLRGGYNLEGSYYSYSWKGYHLEVLILWMWIEAFHLDLFLFLEMATPLSCSACSCAIDRVRPC